MPLDNPVSFVIFVVVVVVFMSLRIVKEYDRGVIFFLGKVTGVRGPGLIILIPFFELMTKVTLRTITMNIPSQKIITKDNVSIDIAAVAYYKIVDPQRSVVAIEDITSAVNQISQTTVRNVVGQFSLDQLLSQTSAINLQIKNVIDGHTEPWGAEVTAVEIKDITLPASAGPRLSQQKVSSRQR
jgi:regulator of protease activity HflC (stomatin/prohibitin superfamily)